MSSSKLVEISSETPSVIRRPRGRINKRACDKCRQLKIRCDGDAQKGSVCSNCEKGTCVYDKSPRKNRQVEKLRTQVNNLELNLKQITNNLENQNFQLEVFKIEKRIMTLLISCQNYFNEREEQSTFDSLVQCIDESRCLAIFLPIIRDLLLRLSSNENENQNIIINCLKRIVESSLSCCEPDSSLRNEYSDELASKVLNFVNLTSGNLSIPNPNHLSVPTTSTTNLGIISGSVSPAASMSTIVSSSPIIDDDGLEIKNISMVEFHESPFVSSSPYIQHNDPYYSIDNINSINNINNNINDINNINTNNSNSSGNIDFSSYLNLDDSNGNFI